MNIMLKYFLLFSYIVIFSVSAECSAEEGYTLDELKASPEILQRIALDIVSQEENINFIQNELRRKHGQAAFDLWSTYNQNDLPNVENLKQLTLSADITQGKAIDAKFRKNNLRPLVGKTKMTLFLEEFIDNVQDFLFQLVENGIISLTENKMFGEGFEDHILVECAFPLPVARVFQKQKASPPIVQEIEAGSDIISIMFAGNYIEALLHNRGAFEESSFQGKVISIYQSEK